MSNFELFNTNNNSFEAVQTQINFNDMEENVLSPGEVPPDSFETYYAIMR